MRYVIIGNSAAAVGAVEGIRQIDQKGEITILTDEPHHVYSRPLLSYYLMGKATAEKMKYRSDGFYDENGCTLLCNAHATQIEPSQKTVVLASGDCLSYDKLLVATGSSALIPPFDGLDTVESMNTFMSMNDALRLERALGGHERVLIVGAGLIGLKCAEGIAKRVSSITVVDLAPRILSSILDEEGAKRVQTHLEDKGIGFRLSCGIKRFSGNTAITQDDETMAFDVLVLAVGVRPNTHLLKGIAEIDKGIVVNGKSETSIPDIYAAGDCTQTVDVSSGQEKIMALLPNAYMQGECAGINMAGGERTFDKAIPMNAIGFFGLPILTAGNTGGDVIATSRENYYKRFYCGENRLKGYILIGNIEKAGIYTSLIRERTPLDSIDFALICEEPGLMAFTKEDRRIKLGGPLK